MAKVLDTEALSVSYGGVKALKAVSLAVEEGQLVGLIGSNGAGKTTLIDAVTGFTSSRGSVKLGGVEISKLASHERARKGLGRTWQSIELFDDLTVLENLTVSSRRPTLKRTFAQLVTGRGTVSGPAERTLAELDLSELAERMPADLSEGQRKLVGVARALVAKPQVLCLDEPAAGLDADESRELGERLRGVVDRGTAMLLVDHDMGLVLSICDRVVVLEFGEVICEGTPDAVRNDPKVIDAYLGSGVGGVESEAPASGTSAPTQEGST